MGITLILPGSLKKWLGGRTEADCNGSTFGECVDDLDNCYPGFKERLVDERDTLKDSMLVFLNGENLRNQKGLTTPVADGDEIGIIPLAAGG